MTRFVRFIPGFLTLILGVASLAAAPRITFTPTGATAEGIRPRGEAIWFVHTVTEFSGSPRLSRVIRVVRDDDGDGTVSIEAMVGRSSVWAVVDYESGEYAVERPEGAAPLRELLDRSNGWAAGRAHLDFGVSDLDVLVVRPGHGAWTLRCFKGGACDGDGRMDANLRIRLEDMKQLHGSNKTATVVLPRDLVIAVHPRKLLTFVRSAGEAKQ